MDAKDCLKKLDDEASSIQGQFTSQEVKFYKKDKKFSEGYRGSSSEQASRKKKEGHKWEKVFAELIGGDLATGKATRKTDVLGPDRKTYSVKGASTNGKWQISLYGINRFREDADFNKISNLGKLYVEYLECFPEKENKDKYFIDKNPIGSNIAMKKRGLRKKIRKNIRINDTTILVSCFDHTTGFGGILNYAAYYRFWYDLFVLQEQNPDHLFCIKTKYNWDTQLNIQNKNIYQILNKINHSNSWINAKDYSLNTCDWIGLSDIVISAPVSSVIFESYYAGFKTISHDPLNQYSQCHRPAEKNEGLSTHSLDQLRALYKTKIGSINKINTAVLPETVDVNFQYNLF